MIRGMAGMTLTMVPAPDSSRTGDILIVKGSLRAALFCMFSLCRQGFSEKDPLLARGDAGCRGRVLPLPYRNVVAWYAFP